MNVRRTNAGEYSILESSAHLVDVKEFQYLDEIADGDVHAYCKICWRPETSTKAALANDSTDDVSVATDDEHPSCDDEDSDLD